MRACARQVEPIVAQGVPSGGLARRARELVARRARLFERVAPYKRSANLVRARSPFLNERHHMLVATLREDLLRWLPELADRTRAVADAVELATSFEAWDRLRGDQRLSAARARETVEATVLALLGVR